ncbi:hypothetical protein B0H11DRAFT_2066171 [Mycena galericulata]|nr:hypothetical protein B0H11DRAFT_2066171 [Mycena galericulata]
MSDAPPSYDVSASNLGLKTTLDDKKTSWAHSQLASISSDSKTVALLGLQAPVGNVGSGSTSGTHSRSRGGLFDAFRKHPRLPSGPPVDTPAVRAAVIDDVRLVVQPNTGSIAERLSLLETCAQLCARHKVEFPPLLQDKKSFLDHTALYWAIVNNPGSPQASFELVAAVLTYSVPLKPATLKEARRACISLRNQELFQFLRMRPEFGALSEQDRFLLGVLVPPEEIDIQLMEGPEQPFSVKFKIPMFQKRMMLSEQICLEFIARGRLWLLSFFTPANPTALASKSEWFKKGQWGGSLHLRENSPGTDVEFGVVLLDARNETTEPTHFWMWCGNGKPLRNEVEPLNDSTFTGWVWPIGVQADSVCIAADGSVMGILAVKLGPGKAGKPKNWPPQTTNPEDACIVC